MAAPIVAGLARAAVSIGNLYKNSKMVYDVLKEVYNIAGKPWVEMQDAAFKAGRTMGMTRDMLVDYTETVIRSSRKMALEYNKSFKDIVEFQEKYGQATGRNVLLSEKQIEYMSGLSNLVDPATAHQLVDEYDKMGVGISGALANTYKIQEQAKNQGLNAAKAAKGLADNIKLASQYSFKNGINDIQKMVLKAQSLRMNMDAVMRAADKFMSIEDAITTSANLQVLGGSFATQFSNPMAAMYEANADPERFMDRFAKMLSGKGQYNAKTGEVRFDPATMMLVRQAAKDLGVAVDDITNPAVAKAQNAAIDKEINRNANASGFSDKDRLALQNLSRGNVDEETGEHLITWIDGYGQHTKKVSEISSKELEIAQDNQLTEEKLYGDVHEIHDWLADALGRAKTNQSLKEDAQGVSNWKDGWIATAANGIMSMVANGLNWAKLKFAEGGVVPQTHAAMGTIVPGDSYAGDKVPVMANSGEMILNQQEQSTMFGLLKNLSGIGANAMIMGTVGSRLGVPGLGRSALMAQAMSGGDAGISDIIQMHAMNKIMTGGSMFGGKNIKPTMSAFDKELEAFKQKWRPQLRKLGESVKTGISNTTRYMGDKFTSLGKGISNQWGRFTRTISNTQIGEFGRDMRSMGRYAYESARDWTVDTYGRGRNWISNRYRGSALQRGINNARLRVDNFINGDGLRYNRATGEATRTGGLLRNTRAAALRLGRTKPMRALGKFGSKTAELVKDTGSLLGKTKYGRLAKIAKAGRLSTLSSVSRTASAASDTARTLGTLSKASKALGTAAKVGGRAMPYVGTAIAIGSAGLEAYGAKKAYDSKVADIENSNMSDLEKARAKDDAVKEKNTSYGKAAGTAAGGAAGAWAGAAAGAAIGSVVPIVGTAIGGLIGGALGAWGGSELGSSLGGGIGSLFGGNNEKKLKEEEEKKKKEQAAKYATHSTGNEMLDAVLDIRDILSIKLGGKDNEDGEGVLSKFTKAAIGLSPIGLIGDAAKSLFSSDEEGGDSLFTKFVKASPLGIAARGVGKMFGGKDNEDGEGVEKNENEDDMIKVLKEIRDAITGKSSNLASAMPNVDEELPKDSSEAKRRESVVTRAMSMFGKPLDLFKHQFGLDEGGFNPLKYSGLSIAMKANPLYAAYKFGKRKYDSSTGEVLPNDAISTEVTPKDGANYTKVAPKEVGTAASSDTTVTLKDNTINLNVSGTIKLDTGGQNMNIDFSKLIDTPEFKRQLVDMVTRSLNERSNAGRYNSESAANNTNKIWNKTGS